MNTIFDNTKTDRQFSAATGLAKDQFNKLVLEYEITERQFFENGLLPSNIPETLQKVEERLFFTLYYLKVYPTFDVLGICFGMDASSSEAFFKKSIFLLEKTLLRLKMLPAREFTDHKQLQKALEGFEEIIIDAAERRTERPENKADQSDAYSGKKKAHTLKNTVICNTKACIVFLGATVWGGIYHDMELFKKDFPPGTNWFKKFKVWMDKGYQGFEKVYSAKAVIRPQKKPKKSKNNPNPDLTDEQKEANQKISRQRIIVEHSIRGMKRYNILVYPLRTFCESLIERVIGVCAGLWNLKINFRCA